MTWRRWHAACWSKAGCASRIRGNYYLDQVMGMLGEHLTYRWTIASVWKGDPDLSTLSMP